jgi:flap endonuclease-1
LIDVKQIRKEMQLTKEEFLDLCILLGTDFSATIQGVGPVRAIALIREFGSIEKILEMKEKLVPYPDFDFMLARKVFTSKFEIPAEWREEGRWDCMSEITDAKREEVELYLSGFEPGMPDFTIKY